MGADRSTGDRRGARAERAARLDALLARVGDGGDLRRLDDGEVEALGRLVRAVATDLALARAFGASVRERERLNALLSRAHDALYGRARAGRGLAGLLAALLSVPDAVRRTWRYHALAALLLVVGGVYGYVAAAADPEWALELVMAGDVRTPYASREELLATLHEGRGDAGPNAGRWDASSKTVFAAYLWQNNTRVALLGLFGGLVGGWATALVLLMNGALLGAYTHTFHAQDLAWGWWAWILPHGVTELGAIVLLGGGGLLVGRQLVAPGERTRREALRAVRADVVRLAALAFPMLFLAALIESFVRQSGLTDPQRYAFAAATTVVWAVFFGLGRGRAAQQALAGRPTLAERAVALPDDADLFQ